MIGQNTGMFEQIIYMPEKTFVRAEMTAQPLKQPALGAASINIHSGMKLQISKIPDPDPWSFGYLDQKLINSGLDHAFFSALSRSAIRSSASSIPQESRIMPSLTSARLRSSGEYAICEVSTGIETRDSTPPSEVA
jgi:hypothetical protein